MVPGLVMSSDGSFEQQLEMLRQSYQARIPSDLEALAERLSGLTGTDSDQEILQSQLIDIHKIAGSAGSFGLPELSTQARRLEHRLQGWLADGDYVSAQQELPSLLDALSYHAVVDQSVAKAEPGAEPNPRFSGELAWLASDDAEMNQLIGQLQAFGYTGQAYSGIDDLVSDSVNEARVVLVDLDAIAPGDLERLRPCVATHYCIGLSARDDFGMRQAAVTAGLQDFAPKPVDSAVMARRIERVLSRFNAPPGRVLVVDDDDLLARFYQTTLETADIEVRVLANPADIMAVLGDFQPDLVLMDLYMPGVSGRELARIIRLYDRWSTLPIVFLSGETDIELRAETVATTFADDFMIKPVPPDILVASVKSRIMRARQLTELMLTDSMTGLMTHARIKEALQAEFSRATRRNSTVSVVIFDLDHFKQVNDQYGHARGDKVIVGAAALMRHAFRHGDMKGRYGGEEFVVVFPDTPGNTALQLVERLRERFASLSFNSDGATFQCTLSAGVASTDWVSSKDADALLEQADRALYQAKADGRNCVRGAD